MRANNADFLGYSDVFAKEKLAMTKANHSAESILNLRYGEQTKPTNLVWNTQIAALLQHRSVRDYLPDALPAGALESMVAAAQSASTSSNLHQWSVVAVTDPILKAQVADLASGKNKDANGFIKQAPAVLLWVADLSRNNRITNEAGGDTKVHDYLDAFVMATVDAALASQNAVVAAESMGLGVVYIGAMRNQAKELAALINLPMHSYVVCGLVVGRPANSPDTPETVRPRPPQQVVLHHDRYDSEHSMRALDAYETEFHKFREGIGMGQWTWKDSVVYSNKFEYMDGREDLRDTVVERGFKLL